MSWEVSVAGFFEEYIHPGFQQQVSMFGRVDRWG